MSSYAGERALDRGLFGRGLDRLLAIEIPTKTEFWLYAGLVLAAVLFRFVDLGTRALHHDESLHATYSWYFAQGRGYQHDPLMHGPFLFHVTALSFVLFGASDASARFPAALLGSIAVMMPLLLRPWLGKIGAFAAAAFIAFSPSILYYSRFIRDDPFVILFTLMLFVSVFRYRLTRHEGWLYLGAASLMLAFTSLEVEFIIAAIVLLYLNGALAHEFAGRYAERANLSSVGRMAAFVGLLPFAWLIALAWPFVDERRRLLAAEDGVLPANGDLLVLFGLLTAPQFSAAIKVPFKKLGYDLAAGNGYSVAGHLLTRTEAVGGLTVIALLLLTFVLGVWWNQRRWLIAAAIFYIPYFLLYTTFLTNKSGWGSGIWGALSYWLDQQDVRRGTQPVFYFAMTLSSYEYLALGLAVAGVVVHAWRRGVDALILLGVAVAALAVGVLVYTSSTRGNVLSIPLFLAALLAVTAAMEGSPLRRFLVFYFGGIFWGLSVAGEKMPWLTEHPALPLTLLAALTVAEALALLPALRDRLSARIWAVVLTAAAAGAAAALLTAAKGSEAARWTGIVLLLAAVAAGVWLLAAYLGTAVTRRWLKAIGAIGAVSFVGFFGLLTFRADWRLNFVHPDTPDEMLIYTQSSQDIPKVAKQIDEYALASGKGHALSITVDSYSSFTWPWAWYLRDYPNTGFPDLSAYLTNPGGLSRSVLGDVVITHSYDEQVMQPFVTSYGQPEMIHHRSWFPENYRGATTSSFFKSIRNGSELTRWWTFITHRDGFAIPPSDVTQYPRAAEPVGDCSGPLFLDTLGRPCLGSENADVYFPAGYTPGKALSLAPPVAPSVAPTVAAGTSVAANASPRAEGQTLVFGAPGSVSGSLSRPAQIALDPQGNVYVADSKNDRVEKFDGNGRIVAASPKLSTVSTAVSSGTSPEAWGVAVDGSGNVYVADTWNDRIDKLDSGLNVIAAFGSPVTNVNQPAQDQLYGPRGLAIDADGNLRVADTGDARVVTYSPDGKELAVNGSRGTAPGQFMEPTDIVTLANGGFAVTDTWNNRIQLFDKNFTPLSSITIPWVNGAIGQDQENKPYLAALPDGSLLVSEPRAGKVQIYKQDGTLVRTLDRLPGMNVAFGDPLGVAVSPAGAIYVADGARDEIDRVPITALTGTPQG
jgi:hypothetical protein